MASFAHVVVGVAAARGLEQSRWLPWRGAATLGVVSVLADADVLAFRFGVPYSAPFGHRGATHSLLFAMLAGIAAAALLARGSRWPDPGGAHRGGHAQQPGPPRFCGRVDLVGATACMGSVAARRRTCSTSANRRLTVLQLTSRGTSCQTYGEGALARLR
jgi:hypothetical protein